MTLDNRSSIATGSEPEITVSLYVVHTVNGLPLQGRPSYTLRCTDLEVAETTGLDLFLFFFEGYKFRNTKK